MFSYLYHASVFCTLQTVLKITLFLAPTSLVQAILTKQLEGWGIRVLVDGEEERRAAKKNNNNKDSAEKKYDCTMTVHDRRFFKRMVVDQMLGHGESYMNGWIDSSDLSKQVMIITGEWLRSKDSMLRYLTYVRNNMAIARNLQTQTKSMKVIDLHYNLGNDLYGLMLDESMNYTCGYWKDVQGEDDLYTAQINKMDLVARKLKLKPGMRVLDIGCGFGATAKFLAQNYGVSVVGYNISKEQLQYARKSCEGLKVEFVEDDYRNAAKSGKFDAIFCLGFFEHIGRHNYRGYFELVDSCLTDVGLHLIQASTLRDAALPHTDDWMNKYIFPGGELPHPQDYFKFSEGLLAVEDVHNFGGDYVKTLRVWKNNFIKNWPKLESKYGPMIDGKFYRMWVNYLEGSIGSFQGRFIHLYQVVHSKQGCKRGLPCGYESVR